MPTSTFDASSYIQVRGARTHNLKNISVNIPRNQLTVVTGLSGSGKSSLVFDTICAEGQRRYLSAFGSYARQFMGEMEPPDVDSIDGISPIVSIEQKTTNRNPRSTVGTVTEIYDFFRLLYARIGKAYSMNTGKIMVSYKEEQLVELLFDKFQGKTISILAPLVRGRKGHYKELFVEIAKKGYLRARVDGTLREIEKDMKVDRYKPHDIEALIDKLAVADENKDRLKKSVAHAMEWSEGLVFVSVDEGSGEKIYQYSKRFMCEDTGISYDDPSPLSFSFNSPYGYCPECKGLGELVKPNIDAIVGEKKLSVSQGAIVPLGEERDSYLFNLVKKVARSHKINLHTPIEKLSKGGLDILLYGAEDFEGIVPIITRWYNSESSDSAHNAIGEYFHKTACPSCEGKRLKKESLFFKLEDKNIAELADLSLQDLLPWTLSMQGNLSKEDAFIATEVLKEIIARINFLLEVGLYYLPMNRGISMLSGGEAQRIRLATQIGSQLQGITYVLDEPSIGLHPRDNDKLISSLKRLKEIGNTVIVVEHDREIMLQSDYIIDIGPGAGEKGGEVVAEGSPKEILQSDSVTAAYLKGALKIEIPKERRKGNGKHLVIKNASGHNLKNVSVSFPLGKFIGVTGVSGSGKSTLIMDTLYPLLHNHCFRTNKNPLAYGSIEGLEHIRGVIEIDQAPIGRTPRSCPATYSGFFTDIRTLFAGLVDAQIKGYKAGHFSFNIKGGRCEVCQGVGMKAIEMSFLPDVYIPCDNCWGKRFDRDILEVRYKFQSISDVLDMSVDQAADFFKSIPYLHRKIKVLQDVGLGYIKLGQNSVTLSGGEAQRIKLSSELVKKSTGSTFYILDEPSTGLHTQDIKLLLGALQELVDKGNTVLVIEHNLDMIKVADHIIDLGMEGGVEGGYVIAEGTPEEVVKKGKGYTASYLKKELYGA